MLGLGWLKSEDVRPRAILPEHEGLYVQNKFAGTVTPGTLVYISGRNTTAASEAAGLGRPTVTKADADAASPANIATYVVVESIPQDGFGKVAKSWTAINVDTSAYAAANDPAYLSATAGLTTETAPSTGAANVQRVGTVRVKSSTVGVIDYNLRDAVPQRFGSGSIIDGFLSADATGRAKMATGYFDSATLEAKFAAAVFRATAASRALFVTGFFDAATVLDKFAADAIVETLLAANSLYARVLANVASIAAGAVPAANIGIPFVYQLSVPDAGSGNIDYTSFPYKHRILGLSYLKTGGAGNAGNSITLHNGTGGNAITNAMNSATDTNFAPVGTLDDAFTDVAANATLRAVTVRAGGNNAALLTVYAMRIA